MTGASRGIGFGIARALAAEGANVALSSRSRESIEAAAAEAGGRAYVHDTQDLDAAPELVRQVESDLGPVDVLVTNTGGPPPSPTPSTSRASSGRPPTASSSSARWLSSTP